VEVFLDFRSLVESASVLTDGAWGTELQFRGLPIGACPDLWNLENPDAVTAVATSYVEAGSEVILTNTFRANGISLAPFGLASQVTSINHAAAAISRRAAAGRALVFGSIGPTGEVLAVTEELRDQIYGVFHQQAIALAETGVDALLIETMSDIEEAKIALDAALTTDLPVIVSFAFDTGKNKDRTMTGVTPEQAAREVTAGGALGVGANCGVGIEASIGICRRLRAATNLPLWIKPNAGLPEVVGGQVRYNTSPEQFASHISGLLQSGAKFVGACCGSNPRFIRAAALRMEKQSRLAATQG
jgi:5-methyltetrahydrofolate--homocysteine methyltransferase